MFPNPQDALPLPPRPSLEHYKKLAKKLVKACKSDDPNAIQHWSEEWVESLVKLSGLKISHRLPVRIQRWIEDVEDFARRKLLNVKPADKQGALADAQFVIARSHGFESWPKFAKQLEALSLKSSAVSRFEAAADAIVTGDISKLKRILREDPALIRARSTREHGATLLHYVSANGVEGYRQKTPKNIVGIAETLLNAGAEVDATADVYGGGCTTLGLAATSAHPRLAGVQNALIQILLDRGAQIERPNIAGNGQTAIMGCLTNGCPEAAHYLAERGAYLGLEESAGLGQLNIVKNFFDETGKPKAGVTVERVNAAFRYACGYGHTEVARFLLDRGTDPAGHSGDGQTGFHYAVIGGNLQTVRMLLKHNPPLESRNIYGGTVLEQTLWSAAHGGNPDVYVAILEALLVGGAKIPERHVPVNASIDTWLAQHGSHAEPTWHWYGEKPPRKK